MWARIIEVMLGCWLAVSPFVFQHGPEQTALWLMDFGGAAALVLFALLSYCERIEKIHLLNAGIGLCLILSGYLSTASASPPPAEQNHVVVGLLLLMLAVIPSRSSQPPKRWEEFYKNQPRQKLKPTANGSD